MTPIPNLPRQRHPKPIITPLAAATLAAILLAATPAQALPPATGANGLNGLGERIGGQITDQISGIVAQLQTYLEQIQAMPSIALDQAQTYLGDLLQGNPDIAAVLGELGIVDPDQLRQQLLDEADPVGRAPAGIASIGVEAAVAGRTIAQGTLSQAGQARIKEELEGVVQTVGDSQALAEAAGERTAPDQQAADNAVQAANQADTASRQAQSLANQGAQLANRAQGATSTQDVLKLLAQQTDRNGQIMSQMSAQLGGSANQLGQLASQLNSHSNQNASSAALQAKAVELAASTATSLEENNVLLSGATLNLTELNDQQRGDRIARSIQDQAEAGRLSQVNATGYRLAY